ncbi:MAG TPA: hypothetical protein VHA37_03145 [Candidatus Saccharimonadales bacterium]|nr:hypothetical protein [Candidatus Saccharimonadales bacterium]
MGTVVKFPKRFRARRPRLGVDLDEVGRMASLLARIATLRAASEGSVTVTDYDGRVLLPDEVEGVADDAMDIKDDMLATREGVKALQACRLAFATYFDAE